MLPLLLTLLVSADPKPIPLWKGTPPGVVAAKGDRRDLTTDKDGKIAGKRLIRLGHVSTPTITVYPAPKGRSSRAAVVVCPGGAYHILALDLEGTEVCAWLNSIGVTAVLLEYRVPRPPAGDYVAGPLMDAQRAIRTVRSMAKELDIDADKVGILGFSAGGHLAISACTRAATPAYEAKDDIDKLSCKPDFALPIYPAYLANKDKTGLGDGVKVTKETPPMFIAYAHDDPLPVEGAVFLYLALKKAGVASELHVYDRGGHGYGLRKTDAPVTSWPARAEEWMRARKLIGK